MRCLVAMKLFVAVLVLSLVLTGQAFAAGGAGVFTLSPMVGLHKIDGSMGLDDGAAFGLGLGHYYSSKWAVEADLRFTPTETESSPSKDIDLWLGSVGAQYHLAPESAWNPYLSFGLGLMFYDISGTNRDYEDIFGYYGGGVKYSLSDKVDFRIDLRHILDHRTNNSDEIKHQLQSMAGLTFNFGNATKPAPTSAPTTIVKEEPMAPADSDEDGVLDPQDQCPGTARGVRVDSIGCPADTDGDGVADYKDACVDTPMGTEVDEHGCPKAVEEVASLSLNILFGVDKAEITPFHGLELKKAADFINKYPMYKVVIEGHTDAQGSEAYNQLLSQRRADSVREALVTKYGFSANQITAAGYGESQPVADNSTSEGRARNRRVEISIRP